MLFQLLLLVVEVVEVVELVVDTTLLQEGLVEEMAQLEMMA
jgi:hypothetical protein